MPILVPSLLDADALAAPRVIAAGGFVPALADADALMPPAAVGYGVPAPALTPADTDTVAAPAVYGAGVAVPLIADADTLAAPAVRGTRAAVSVLVLAADTDSLAPPVIYGAGVSVPSLSDADTLHPPVPLSGCESILARLAAIVAAREADAAPLAATLAPLLDVAGADPVWVPWGGTELPSVGLLVGRINNLGGGLSRWTYQSRDGGETALNLPATVAPARTRAWINGVPMGPEEATIGTDDIVLDAEINPGDRLTLRSYG